MLKVFECLATFIIRVLLMSVAAAFAAGLFNIAINDIFPHLEFTYGRSFSVMMIIGAAKFVWDFEKLI